MKYNTPGQLEGSHRAPAWSVEWTSVWNIAIQQKKTFSEAKIKSGKWGELFVFMRDVARLKLISWFGALVVIGCLIRSQEKLHITTERRGAQ